MLKDQLRRRRAQDLGSYMDALSAGTATPAPFLMPAEFYTSLFASAVLQQQQQYEPNRWYPQTPSPTPTPPTKSAAAATPPPAHLSSNLLFSAVCVAAVESAKRSQLKPQEATEAKDKQQNQSKADDAELDEHVSIRRLFLKEGIN